MNQFRTHNIILFICGILLLFSCKEKGLTKTFTNGSLSVVFPDTTISFEYNSGVGVLYNDLSEYASIRIYGEQYDTSTNFFELQFAEYTIFKSGHTYTIDMTDIWNQHTGGVVGGITNPGSYTLNPNTMTNGSISFEQIDINRVKGHLSGNFIHMYVDYPLQCNFDFTP